MLSQSIQMASPLGDRVASPIGQRTDECGNMATRQWTDLPSELLPPIAERLGLIELLSFRGVCKDWNSSSSTATAEIESLSNHEPWFLLYGENSQCLLVSRSGKKYTINIQEFDGATCIASNQGWLLLFKEGSMFFFCPFSRAKIDLPQFPQAEISNHVAAFSSPPTSKDCIVSVISRSKEKDFELHVIHHGDSAWTKHELDGLHEDIDTIKCAAYHDGEFYFFDEIDGLLTFSVKQKNWDKFRVVPVPPSKDTREELIPFGSIKAFFRRNGMMKKLGLAEDVSISTCGTVVRINKFDRLVFNESIVNPEESERRRSLKGVWIQPRFFQISPQQNWLL